jgi:negative regulator of flagellin synthesis FlgM
MKIANTGGNAPLNQIVKDKTSGPKPVAIKASGTPAISLSNLSTQLQALESDLSDNSHFDAAKVEAIKKAIQSGQFKINPEAVADKLIANVRDMIGK